ncbi:unnamed protein product [Larinioides sclopetarius]|uniref:TIL domain-containing protein n=1 Tax=Larinioides sclopetarius TaxID=280406 RepID=A0AAV2BRI2_9ARAC
MKAPFFLCAVALLMAVVISDESFFQKLGLTGLCSVNHTFSEYDPCGKRCDEPDPSKTCAAVTFVGCGCKDGYIPTDKSFSICVLPQDCP